MSAWNDAGTRPDHPCLCETIFLDSTAVDEYRGLGFIEDPIYQVWNGKFFCEYSHDKDEALNSHDRSMFQDVQWREVQP